MLYEDLGKWLPAYANHLVDYLPNDLQDKIAELLEAANSFFQTEKTVLADSREQKQSVMEVMTAIKAEAKKQDICINFA